ncbi:MAG: hypothetical protein WD850_00110 [Candidatus Spechtbacterales bacterium]
MAQETPQQNTASNRQSQGQRGPGGFQQRGGQRGGPGGFQQRGGQRGGPGGQGRGRFNAGPQQPQEYEQKVLDIARVARVTKGGRRFTFRATMAIGNRKGKVGIATGRGRDVALAIEKAARNARQHLIEAPMTPGGALPHETTGKQTSSVVFLKPGKPGRGIIAGGAIRIICELAGYKDISGKIIGRSTNKLNNASATMQALEAVVYTPDAPAKKDTAADKDKKEAAPAKKKGSTSKSTKDKASPKEAGKKAGEKKSPKSEKKPTKGTPKT